MDVASTGQASAQISSLQRAQQASINGLRSSQLQAQSIASVLAQSVDATKGANVVQPPAQPAQTGNSGDGSGGSQGSTGSSGNAGQGRGSLVNILV